MRFSAGRIIQGIAGGLAAHRTGTTEGEELRRQRGRQAEADKRAQAADERADETARTSALMAQLRLDLQRQTQERLAREAEQREDRLRAAAKAPRPKPQRAERPAPRPSTASTAGERRAARIATRTSRLVDIWMRSNEGATPEQIEAATARFRSQAEREYGVGGTPRPGQRPPLPVLPPIPD